MSENVNISFFLSLFLSLSLCVSVCVCVCGFVLDQDVAVPSMR